MTKKITPKKIIPSIIFLGLFCAVRIGQAKSLMGDCVEDGSCQLNHLMQVAITATEIILGLTGTVALLAFVYGGFLFLISAGSNERVSEAKKVIQGAIIGMVIVFLSYGIISFMFLALGIENSGWESSDWFK